MAGKTGRTLFFAMSCILVSLTGSLYVKANMCAIEDSCKAGETCCELTDGQYGCCPYPNGMCCPDHEHCCPSGYYCLHQTCVRLSAIPNIIYKMAPKEIDQHLNAKICPADFTSCKGNKSGQTEFCCPMPNAVCCNDQHHCCPSGAKCSSQKRGCEWEAIRPLIRRMNAFPITYNKQLPTAMIQATKSDTPCPGYSTVCPPNNTCCLNKDVVFVCCPYKDAACCSQGSYCCPYGSYCVGEMRCQPIR